MNNLDLRTNLKIGIEYELKTINRKCFKCQYYLLFYEKGLPLEAVIILSKLFDWEGKQANKKEFYIFKTIKELQQETGLSRYKQEKGINILKKLNFIEVFLKGIPRKRHFFLNIVKLSTFVFSKGKVIKNHSYSLFKNQQTYVRNVNTLIQINQNNNKITKNTKTIIKNFKN